MVEVKEKYNLDNSYSGPFYGFSGLVFGLSTLKKIDSLCLFGKTEPNLDDPQKPDEKTSEELYNKLIDMLNIT